MNTPENREWRKKNSEKVIRLYEAGLTVKEVAEKFNVGEKRIYNIVRMNCRVRSKSYYAAGKRNSAWKGGVIIDKHGYRLIYAPNHPFRTKSNRVREHRLVMEKKLGRYLKPEEVVDHINGKKDDNRPSNLRVYKNNAAHLAATLKGRRPQWTKEGKKRLEKLWSSRRGVPASEW